MLHKMTLVVSTESPVAALAQQNKNFRFEFHVKCLVSV